MRHRTFKFRRVTAAAVLGLGMSAGVIGVTAGTAGATGTTPQVDTATGPAAPTVTATQAGYTAGGVEMSLGTAAIVSQSFTVHLAASTSGTVDWTSATVTEHGGAAGVTTHVLATTGLGSSALTFTLTATTTAVDNHYVVITPDTLTNHAAFGTITATPSGSSIYAAGSAVTVAHGPSATVTTGKSQITATSAPTVPSTGTGNKAGTLVIKLHVGKGEPTSTLTLNVAPGTTATTPGHVYWDTANVTSSGVTATETPPTGASSALTIKLSNATATATDTVDVTGITYNTVSAKGTITVTPTWTLLTGASAGTFTATHATAVNAVSATALPPAAPTIKVTATSQPPIGVGITNQSVGSQKVTITGTKSNTEGWNAGATITLLVNGATCGKTTFVAYDGVPTVAFTSTSSSHLSATPKVSAKVTSHTCAVTRTNALVITLTNAVTLKKTTKATPTTAAVAVFTITGEHYSVGATAANGAVTITGTTKTFAVTNPKPTTGAAASNAFVASVYVSTTPVKMAPGSYDHPVTPISVVESTAGTVPKGYVCVTDTYAGTTNGFNTSATPSVKVTTGNGVVAKTVKYLPATTATVKTVAFDVTTASSTTKPSTYVLSGLAVNAPAGTTVKVSVTVKAGATKTCTTGTNLPFPTAVLFTTGTVSTQIGGTTADATAAKLLETKFPATGATHSCAGGKANLPATRPVILATTEHYQDALSSQYLASYLDTGTLLTPTAKLSSVTLNALKTEGITQVDVVGGPLVVSTTVVAQLMTTPAYTCGGGAKLTTGGATRFLSVTRIYGQTAPDTAAAVAEFVATSHVATASFIGAYAGVNATKGNGKFNDTAGTASPAPLSGLPEKTAILASTTEFQDAMAASTLSYWQNATHQSMPILLTNPLSLSSATEGAITTLGIKQVIVMGGQLAITNSVTTSLETLGMQVLRVAGKSYTDTAVQLAKFEVATGITGFNWTINNTVAISRGNGFTDGLTGAVVTANHTGTNHTEHPLLLTESPTVVGTYLTAFLKASGKTTKGIDTRGTTSRILTLDIFGGPLAVSPAVVSQMETDIS